jgi:hypothetical protein
MVDGPVAETLPPTQPVSEAWPLRGLVAGAILGIPLGILLAFVGAIPYQLGLFFYLVLGLLIGAVMFRACRSAAPIAIHRLRPIGVAVALIVWFTSLTTEYRTFPNEAAEATIKNSLLSSASDAEVAAARERARAEPLEKLREQYPPGGLIGYVRWVASSGRMELSRFGTDEPHTYIVPGQKRIAWISRAVLSLILLACAINSQFTGLAEPLNPQKAPEAEPNQPQDAETEK